MDSTLLYFEACPNYKVTDERLSVLAGERPGIRVTHHLVDTPAEAVRTRYHGLPSIHVDGVDVLAAPDAEVGLSCRQYPTPDGHEGAPTPEQLRAVLADA